MYYTVQELREMHCIPEFALNGMLDTCKCGAPIVRNVTLTKAKCSDTHCRFHLAHRAARMLKYLDIKGYGPETCRKLLTQYHLYAHIPLLGKLIDYKPKVYLWEIAKLECIDGYDSQCEELFAGYKTFEDYFRNAGDIPASVRERTYNLVSAEKFFDIKRPLSRNNVKVTIHGSVPGYRNRDMYIAHLNDLYGKLIRLVPKTTAGPCDFVITTEKYSQHRKITDARKYGIPILSPKEFESELVTLIEKHLKCGKISIEDMDDFLEDIDGRNK